MTASRRDDWPEQLARAVDEAHQRPLAWGQHDCALWAAATVRAMRSDGLGGDIVALRGTYKSIRGAARILRVRYRADLLGAAEQVMGGPGQADISRWHRGDLVGCRNLGEEMSAGFGSSLGIWLGCEAALVGADGLAFARPADLAEAGTALLGWSV